MKRYNLQTFFKDSKIYKGSFPIIVGGAINCVQNSTNINSKQVFLDEECNCEILGYTSIVPSTSCWNGSDTITYNCIDGKILTCYKECDAEPIIGKNSAYVGFGGSTGALFNEHWIHDFRWVSILDDISYENFLSNINYVNNAVLIDSSIRLTDASIAKSGNVFDKNPVKFLDNSGNLMDWSVFFTYSMGSGYSRADGISFILQSNTYDTGAGGGGIGYGDIRNSIAVSYDSYQNVWDINNNHVELNINGYPESSLTAVPCPFDICGTTGTNKFVYNWIDYIDGIIYVYTSLTNNKPSTSLISYEIDIRDYLILS